MESSGLLTGGRGDLAKSLSLNFVIFHGEILSPYEKEVGNFPKKDSTISNADSIVTDRDVLLETLGTLSLMVELVIGFDKTIAWFGLPSTLFCFILGWSSLSEA